MKGAIVPQRDQYRWLRSQDSSFQPIYIKPYCYNLKLVLLGHIEVFFASVPSMQTFIF